MAGVNLLDYRWAAIKMARAAWRRYGSNSSVSRDDAEAEGLLALNEAPRTFDPTRWGGWDQSQCRGTFGLYVKRAAWNAAKRLILRESRHRAQPLPEFLGEAHPPDERALRLRRYLAEHPEHAQLLARVADDGLVNAKAAAVVDELRRRLGESRSHERMMTSGQAAASLRMADRRVRALCEQGTLHARRQDGTWVVPRAEVARYRERRIIKALEAGASYREAREAGRCSVRTVAKAAKRQRLTRRPGRPAKHDHELVLSMLSDPVAHPQLWSDGAPVFRAIARAAGCPEGQVRRLARR